MDELIERLERKFHGPDRLTMADRYDAATALRAYAERKKELVEALEKIATDCEADGPGTIHEGLAKFARAILSKHKAPA